MTHYEIDYGTMQEPEKHNKALQDIKDYLGEDRFEHLTELLRLDKALATNYCRFSWLASFSGIQGYPTMAWHNHCYGYAPGSTEGDTPDTMAKKGD
jgi:hypothetical protein